MKSLWFGIIGMAVMVALSVEGGLGNYAQKHAIYLVCGGTFFLIFFTTPDSSLKSLWLALKRLTKNEDQFTDFKEELETLARTKTLGSPSKSILINYAKELWEQGVDPNLFVVLLSQRRMELEQDMMEALQTMKNLSKYPPGLGITGTVMGMIALFSSLDENKDAIGANIALAMAATFFGLFLTNVFIGPIADRIQIRHVHRKHLLNNIYKILLLINQNEPTALISGEMEDEKVA